MIDGEMPLIGYGYTTVFCLMCENVRRMYGYLPMARQIWELNEGLECCFRQTIIINQEYGDE